MNIAAERELWHERALRVCAVRVGQHDGYWNEQLGLGALRGLVDEEMRPVRLDNVLREVVRVQRRYHFALEHH